MKIVGTSEPCFGPGIAIMASVGFRCRVFCFLRRPVRSTHHSPPLLTSPLHRYIHCVVQYMHKKYYCSCGKICKGRRREVCKATYFNHKPHWESDRLSKYTPGFWALLDKNNPTTGHKSPSQPAQSSRVHTHGPSDKNTDRAIHPPNNQSRQSGDDTSQLEDVSTSFRDILDDAN